MSPNEFMFPQRIPIIGDDGVKRKNDGSVDSMGVLEQMEAAEQRERQMALAAAESQVTQPVIDSKDTKTDREAVVYRYEVYDGMRNFWCKGKIQTGPDSKNLIIVIMLVNVTNALSLGFSWIVSCQKFKRRFSF